MINAPLDRRVAVAPTLHLVVDGIEISETDVGLFVDNNWKKSHELAWYWWNVKYNMNR